MLCNLTTDKLSLITNQTGDIDVVVTYIERTISTGAIGKADRQLTNITAATTTDILAVPAADTARKVLAISIRNAHASTSNDVTVQFNANGTLYELFSVRLYATEKLEWDESRGFEHIRRREIPHFSRGMSTVIVTALQSVNAGSKQTLDGCTTSVKGSKAGSLSRRIANFGFVYEDSALTTTGVGLAGLQDVITATIGRHSAIGSVVASVTASTQATATASFAGAKATPTALGTCTTASRLLHFTSSMFSWTEGAVQNPFQYYLAAQSEVGGSTVTIHRGAVLEVFEATD